MGPPEKDHSAVVLGLICRPYGADTEVRAVRCYPAMVPTGPAGSGDDLRWRGLILCWS